MKSFILVLFLVFFINAYAQKPRFIGKENFDYSSPENFRASTKRFGNVTLLEIQRDAQDIHKVLDRKVWNIRDSLAILDRETMADLNDRYQKYKRPYDANKHNTDTYKCQLDAYINVLRILKYLPPKARPCKIMAEHRVKPLIPDFLSNINTLLSKLQVKVDAISNCAFPWLLDRVESCAVSKAEKLRNELEADTEWLKKTYKASLITLTLIRTEMKACLKIMTDEAAIAEKNVVRDLEACDED
ncbi:unnamed protein product [Hermetia illucens]|uniref:Uncharacterized protein n=1 Tax=Hermetia illucens TaxID=343691 RepID=A0A7R8UAK0_HERIL|nr:uncharacterized protein LOC119646227 [Hermetia illucens]CAD7077245.1 unnamed protein product [Hermetia illucens]